jgi:DNA uptake protein ComE-like DNA-binding protein
MVANGAKIPLDDVPAITEYLAANFGPDKKPLGLPVPVNTAPIDQLKLIPSLAPCAQAIVDARQKTPFARVDDLTSVECVSKDALEKARPFLSVG